MKPNLIIAGDELRAGIDMDDVEQTGPVKHAVVITFDDEDQMKDAIRAGTVDFDYMRRDETA